MEKTRDSFFLADKKTKKEFKGKKKDKFDTIENPVNVKKTVQGGQGDFKTRRQDDFSKNRKGLEDQHSAEKEKKPFDKKSYRLKKYSKKYKLDQWEEQRKKKLLRNYYKEVNNDPAIGSYKPITFDDEVDSNQQIGKFVRHPDLLEVQSNTVNGVAEVEAAQANSSGIQRKGKGNKDAFQKAQEQYKKIQQQKIEKQEEKARAKDEKQQKLKEYKKKKQERFKKLSKKTKRGQPVMTGRLELLLEKIQRSK